MPNTSMLRDTAEITLLVLSAFGIALLILLSRVAMRDLRRFAKDLKRFVGGAKRRRKRTRIMRLAEGYSDQDLFRISYALLAWPLDGFPDRALFMPRPPHYRLRLKTGGYPARIPAGFQEPDLRDLELKDRAELLAVIGAAISRRSLSSLQWIETCLESGGRPVAIAPENSERVLPDVREP